MTKRAARWAVAVLVAIDILLAALIGAQHGETISHYANRNIDTWGAPVCAVLDWIDRNHCAKVLY